MIAMMASHTAGIYYYFFYKWSHIPEDKYGDKSSDDGNNDNN